MSKDLAVKTVTWGACCQKSVYLLVATLCQTFDAAAMVEGLVKEDKRVLVQVSPARSGDDHKNQNRKGKKWIERVNRD